MGGTVTSFAVASIENAAVGISGSMTCLASTPILRGMNIYSALGLGQIKMYHGANLVSI